MILKDGLVSRGGFCVTFGRQWGKDGLGGGGRCIKERDNGAGVRISMALVIVQERSKKSEKGERRGFFRS